MNKRISCLIGTFIILLSLSAAAEENKSHPESTIALDEVVVTASRLEEPMKDVNANVTVLDEQKIEISPAKNLGDLLAEENIGHIHKYPGNQTSIGIRGFRGSPTGNDLQGKILILLNGRRAGTTNVANIMTENIERVEIIRGPASVQYGSAAMGGIINVITKKGRGEPGFFVNGKLGSFGYNSSSAGFAGQLKSFDFSGSVSRSQMDDYDTADDEDYKNTGYDEKKNISLHLGYEFLPNNRIGVIYTGFEADEVGSPYYLSKNDLDDYSDHSNESLDFVYTGQSRENLFSWKARYFLGEDEYEFTDPLASDPDMIDDGLPEQTDTDHRGAQAQMSWNPGNYTLTGGVDWSNYEIEQDYAPNKTEYDNPSYFLMGKARYFKERLILSGGVRYDDYEIEVKEGQGKTKDDDNISPRFGASFFLLDGLKLRASYGEGFRMPSVSELYIDFMGYYGNPDLDPAESNNYEVGLDWYHEAFNASLTYFYTDWEDKIEVEQTGPFSYTYKNIGEATVSGFEGSLSCNLGQLLKLHWKIKPYLNFTYLTEYEDENENVDLHNVSDMLLSYGVFLSDYNGFSMKLNLAYTGEQDVEDYESGIYPTPVIEKGGFTVASLSVRKRLLEFNDSGDLSLNGAIQNLFAKDYAYIKGYPMPGRSFEMGLEYRY